MSVKALTTYWTDPLRLESLRQWVRMPGEYLGETMNKVRWGNLESE